tara:strand:+ start:91 stop:645 length:555 start_codon:yes stop_codon:yes gene_type:complete
MRRTTLLLSALVVGLTPLTAQAQRAEIEKALLAAPPTMRENAMVIKMAADGSHTVLREGSNGLMCWDRSDEPNRTFSVQCSSEENLERVKQNRAFNMSGGTPEEIRAMRDAAEADGSRKESKFGSVYYTLNGEDAESASLHLTIAVPHATEATLGLPEQGSYTLPGSWIMEPGTTSAHIMLPGQ